MEDVISNGWPDGLAPASISHNPRSISGILQQGANPNGATLYYKRATEVDMLDREAAELQRAMAVTSHIRVVKPIEVRMVHRDHRLLITEHVENTDKLFNYVWNNLRWWNVRRFEYLSPEELGQRLARWLSVYHASTASSQVQFSALLKLIVKQTRGKLAAVKRQSAQIPLQVQDRILGFLDSIEGAAGSWRKELSCQIHGDFGMANVLINADGHLFVLDFADTRIGLPWEDLVRVWHELWTISQLSSGRSRHLQPCLDALIRGYGLADEVYSDPLFILIRCWNAVCNVLTSVLFSRKIGFTAGLAARRLAKVNVHWLESVGWPHV